MSNLIVSRGDQEIIGKVGICKKPQKLENTAFLAQNLSRIRTYTVLNTLSGDCNFDISGLKYCKYFPKKAMYKITIYK